MVNGEKRIDCDTVTPIISRGDYFNTSKPFISDFSSKNNV